MSEGFSFFLERIRSSGADLQGLGNEVDQGRGATNAQLAGDNSIWGNDEAGSAFAGGYRDVAELTAEMLGALASAFDATGTNLATTAAYVQEADNASIDRVQRVAAESEL